MVVTLLIVDEFTSTVNADFMKSINAGFLYFQHFNVKRSYREKQQEFPEVSKSLRFTNAASTMLYIIVGLEEDTDSLWVVE